MADRPGLSDLLAAWPIFRDPILAAILAGAVLGWMGTWVVLRRAIFVTAAFSQAAALGVAGAFFVQIHLGVPIPPLGSAMALSLVTAGLSAVGVERWRLERDQLLAWLYLGAGAGAVVVGSHIAQEAHDVDSILFGTAVLVQAEDLAALAWAAALAAVGQLAGFRALLFVTVDSDGARVRGLPVTRIELSFWVALAVVVSVATRALGAFPVFAMAVLPGAAALLVTDRIGRVFLLAAALGALGGFGGYLAAFRWGTPVGATQALVLAMFWLFAALMRRGRGRG